jgi:hypothetical protein
MPANYSSYSWADSSKTLVIVKAPSLHYKNCPEGRSTGHWGRSEDSGGTGYAEFIKGKKLKIEVILAIMHLECIFARMGRTPKRLPVPRMIKLLSGPDSR